MPGLVSHAAAETLRDGRRVEISALGPSDRAGLVAVMDPAGPPPAPARLSAAGHGPTGDGIARPAGLDRADLVVLVAVLDEGGRRATVGAGRYVVVGPATAEAAFAVLPRYQGRGIGTALMRHVAALARRAGLQELTAEGLPEDVVLLKLFRRSGFGLATRYAHGAVRLALRLP